MCLDSAKPSSRRVGTAALRQVKCAPGHQLDDDTTDLFNPQEAPHLMARTHGKILCSIWENEDFLALNGDAQRLYMLIFSQSKLNLVGLLDYRPGRWATKAPDTSREDIEAIVAHLEDSRFVVVDRETEELVVRSFTRSDPVQIANSKLRKGLWTAWMAIESTALREVVVKEMPETIWEYPETPPLALSFRRSHRMEAEAEAEAIRPPKGEPAEPPIEGGTDTPPPQPPPQPPPATATARPHAPTTTPRPVDKPEPPNPSSQIPHFTADQVETIDPDERAIGLTIAHEIRNGLDRLLDDPQPQDHPA